jgi:uncharacterized phiE125 gp8 family phage protein
MRPSFDLTSPPTVEPVTLIEAKAHARCEHAAEDGLFNRFIAAGRRYVEQACGLALIEQTWRGTWATWPKSGLMLRPHPVSALTAVTIAGVDATALFRLVKGRPALVTLASGASAPPANAEITATFKAGFAADAAAVPEDLKQAILMLVAHWYENREPTAIAANLAVVGDIKFTVDALLSPHRALRLV